MQGVPVAVNLSTSTNGESQVNFARANSKVPQLSPTITRRSLVDLAPFGDRRNRGIGRRTGRLVPGGGAVSAGTKKDGLTQTNRGETGQNRISHVLRCSIKDLRQLPLQDMRTPLDGLLDPLNSTQPAEA